MENFSDFSNGYIFSTAKKYIGITYRFNRRIYFFFLRKISFKKKEKWTSPLKKRKF